MHAIVWKWAKKTNNLQFTAVPWWDDRLLKYVEIAEKIDSSATLKSTVAHSVKMPTCEFVMFSENGKHFVQKCVPTLKMYICPFI